MTIDAVDDAVTVDTRGMRCPWPVLRLARAMRHERKVALIADDPRAGAEVAALAQEHGWGVARMGNQQGADGWIVSRD